MLTFLQLGRPVAAGATLVGAFCFFFSYLLRAMVTLPRIIYSMSSDGLIFRWLSAVHPEYRVKYSALIGLSYNEATSACRGHTVIGEKAFPTSHRIAFYVVPSNDAFTSDGALLVCRLKSINDLVFICQLASLSRLSFGAVISH